tara:strand:- start:485 stop:904 length:420 start_codon:yes stop_codon:yes gene_type:complete
MNRKNKLNGLKELVLSGALPVGILAAAVTVGYSASTVTGEVTGERIFRYAGEDHIELTLQDDGDEQLFHVHGNRWGIHDLSNDLNVGDTVTVFSPPIFLPDPYGRRNVSIRSVWKDSTISEIQTAAHKEQDATSSEYSF